MFDPASFESLEALEKQKAKEADEAQLTTKYANPERFTGEKEALATSLGYKPFVDPDTKTEDINPKTSDTGNEKIMSGENDGVLIGSVGDDTTSQEETTGEIGKKDNSLNGAKNTGEEQDKNPEIKTETGALTCEYAPLLEQFAKDGKLDPKEVRQLIDTNISKDNYNEVLQNSQLSPEKKKALGASLGYLGSDTQTQEAKTQLNSKIPETFAKFKSPKKGGKPGEAQWNSANAEDAYNELAEHYIGTAQTPEEEKIQLNLALQMSAEKLGKQAQLGLNGTNQETYNHALLSAKNTELPNEERFEALTQLAAIKNTGSGALSEKRSKSQNTEALQSALIESGQLEAFEAIQAEITKAQAGNNPVALETAEAQKAEILRKIHIASSAVGEMNIAMEAVSESPTKTA